MRRGFFGSHPAGLRVLFFVELWERFSYYGMRALLVLFMVAPEAAGGLGMDTAAAAIIYGNYTMAVYMLSIPGGFVADRLVGARNAVVVGGVVLAAGHFSLAVPTTSTFYAGLVLIAAGTGLFKPNISALVGGLYPSSDPRRDAGFSLFYMGINIGALIAPLVTGFLAQGVLFKSWLGDWGIDPALSWHWGFGAAGVGMLLGLLLFLWRGGEVGVEPDIPVRGAGIDAVQGLSILVATVLLGALAILSDREGFTWLRVFFVALPIALAVRFGLAPDEERRRLGAVLVFFVAAMVFWAIFEQMGVTIALFADQLTRTEVLGVHFPSAWVQSLNAFFVITLAPVFAWLWVRLGSRQPSSPVKFVLGLTLLSCSFFLMVPAAALAVAGKVSPLWLVGLFFLQTAGELCLSPVGLSTMTKLAPRGMMGLILGVWFLGAALGNKLAGVLGGAFTASDPGALAGHFFWQAIVVALAALALLALTPWVKKLMGGVA
jgi:proton-dependent oligopeptide transporter, POT family